MAKFLNVGHRGAAAYAPENTVASFEEAIARHADMVEFDIRRTRDGVIVLFHDDSIVTPKGERKPISKVTSEELSQLARVNGYELAAFEEVLKRFGSRIPLNIEIKDGGFEREVVGLLKQYKPAFEPAFSSFSPWVIARLKRIDKSLKTALIVGRMRFMGFNILFRPIMQLIVRSLGIEAMHLRGSLVSPNVVENLSRAGVTTLVWTVNDPDEMRRFLKMGVGGIFTDKPDVLYDVCLEMADAAVLKKVSEEIGRFTYAV